MHNLSHCMNICECICMLLPCFLVLCSVCIVLKETAFRSGDQVFITSRTLAGVQNVAEDMKAEVNPTHTT